MRTNLVVRCCVVTAHRDNNLNISTNIEVKLNNLNNWNRLGAANTFPSAYGPAGQSRRFNRVIQDSCDLDREDLSLAFRCLQCCFLQQ
jgi:hypothetical protein